ncbi:MAG: hypothetical protein WCG20_01175 [bacterium]
MKKELIARLVTLTQTARENTENKSRLKRMQRDEVEQERQRAEAVAFIQNIDEKLITAASEGKNSFEVCDAMHYDYEKLSMFQKTVLDELKTGGYPVKVCTLYGYDGSSQEFPYYKIIITW